MTPFEHKNFIRDIYKQQIQCQKIYMNSGDQIWTKINSIRFIDKIMTLIIENIPMIFNSYLKFYTP